MKPSVLEVSPKVHESTSHPVTQIICPRPGEGFEQAERGGSVDTEKRGRECGSVRGFPVSGQYKIPRGNISGLGSFKPTGESGESLPFSSLTGT